ncbi:hypothetical protein D3C76_1046340 [compost metagenome]
MEHTLVDHRRVLLSVDHTLGAKAVQSGDRLAGFQGLPRRVALRRREARVEGAAAEHEELHAGIAITLAEAGVVGRAFIAELPHRRQRGMVGEEPVVGEHGAQHTAGGGVLDGAVELAVQVGGGEVHAAIRGVGAGADGAGVGSPHARGRAAGGQQRHGFLGGLGDDFGVGA